VPAYIDGAFEALPRTRRVPRLRPISVTFGGPVLPVALRAGGCGQSDEERTANALQQRVAALAGEAATGLEA
jgi:long-chain acyl-CoA synthetase